MLTLNSSRLDQYLRGQEGHRQRRCIRKRNGERITLFRSGALLQNVSAAVPHDRRNGQQHHWLYNKSKESQPKLRWKLWRGGRKLLFRTYLVLSRQVYASQDILRKQATLNVLARLKFNPQKRCTDFEFNQALIALKGSPVGFGTDIGGSIRIPAAFNGLYGLRPSAGRLPYE